MAGDLSDIEEHDWPAVKEGLRKGLYGVNEALPVATTDLDELVATKPTGPIITARQAPECAGHDRDHRQGKADSGRIVR